MIVIDPGHGGADPGAVGNGIVEKDYNLLISNYMYDRFQDLNIPAVSTRTTDEEVSPAERVNRILSAYGNNKDVIVISNHINAGGGDGAEVIYALRNNSVLSNLILEEISKEGQNIRKAYQRRLPSDTSKDYYFIHRETGVTEPVIIEYGFLDNAADATQLKNNWKDYAEAVVRAISIYLNRPYVPQPGESVYTVQKGDSLYSIARKFNTTVDELKRVNNLTTNSLNVGQILKLPTEIETENYITYTVKAGDNLYSIARTYNIPLTNLIEFNNLTSTSLSVGQKISFQNGVFYGTGNILGYDYNKYTKTVSINEEQAKTVKFIFQSFLDGKGTGEIKFDLEKNGYLTATGLKRWDTATVNRILRNSFYCGRVVYRKVFVKDYLEQKKYKNNGEVEQIVVEGKHQPLISKDDFDKVQKILDDRVLIIKENAKVGIKSHKSIWGNKLQCECGSKFSRKVYHKTNDNTTYCFQCYKQKNMGSLKKRLSKGLDIEGACDIPMLQEWKLDLMGSVIFDLIWVDKEKIINMANALIDEFITSEDESNEYLEEISDIKRKIDNLNEKLDKLIDMYLNNTINKDKYIEKKNELEYDLELLSSKKKELESKCSVPKSSIEMKLRGLKQNIIDNLNYNETKVSDEMLDSFVDKIIVKKDRFEWKFNFLSNIKEQSGEESYDEVYLTSINITQDDASEFFSKQGIFKNYKKIIEPIRVDIYI